MCVSNWKELTSMRIQGFVVVHKRPGSLLGVVVVVPVKRLAQKVLCTLSGIRPLISEGHHEQGSVSGAALQRSLEIHRRAQVIVLEVQCSNLPCELRRLR